MEELWEVFYNTEEDGDLYAISIVDSPANKLSFIALNETEKTNQIQLKSDEKKKILYGIVLRADQKIYREKENGDPFYMSFNRETIVKLSQDFFKKGFQNNSTFNHDKKSELNDATVVENWIVENPKNDKASHIGLQVQEGDWVIGMKLGDESWNKYIETGKAIGFSIDSFLRLKKVKMKSENTHEKSVTKIKNKKGQMSIVKQFLKMLSAFKLAEVEVNGQTLTAEDFTEGNVVYTEDGNVFAGEFEYDGKIITTDAEGVIVSVIEKEVEMEEDAPVEEAVEEAVDTVEDAVDVLKAEIESLKKELEDEKAQNVEMKKLQTEVVKLKAELKDLKAKPVIAKVQATPQNMARTNMKMSRMDIIADIVQKNKNK